MKQRENWKDLEGGRRACNREKTAVSGDEFMKIII